MRFPYFRFSSKCVAEISRAQHENAMLVYLRGTPIWRPDNSINIWSLLWLSRPLIISTGKTSIYISTFLNALTSRRDQNHEVGIYFSTNSIVALCHALPYNSKIQNALVTKRSTPLTCKIADRYKFTVSYTS